MKIYTKTGDDGTTGLFGGGRVTKDSPRVAAYGTVDELNALIGLARAAGSGSDRPAPGDLADLDALLARIQNDLFELGADLATPDGMKTESHVRRVDAGDARYLEEAIDRIDKELAPLQQFVLPGGNLFAAALHAARAVCRRAERGVVSLSTAETVTPGVLVFLNRLSDLLFVMGRAANARANVAEPVWKRREA